MIGEKSRFQQLIYTHCLVFPLARRCVPITIQEMPFALSSDQNLPIAKLYFKNSYVFQSVTNTIR